MHVRMDMHTGTLSNLSIMNKHNSDLTYACTYIRMDMHTGTSSNLSTMN